MMMVESVVIAIIFSLIFVLIDDSDAGDVEYDDQYRATDAFQERGGR